MALGYGRFRLGHRVYYAHRIAYRLVHGHLMKGAVVMHSCDNPNCVNPAHLQAGSQRNNMATRGRNR